MDREMAHLTEEQLVLHYYGDSEHAAIDAHLAECLACREEYAALQRLLNSMDGLPVPERGADYGERVWLKVSGKLGLDAKRSRWKRLSGSWNAAVPRWAVAGGVTVLLALAFLAGRWTVHPTGPESQVVAKGGGASVSC